MGTLCIFCRELKTALKIKALLKIISLEYGTFISRNYYFFIELINLTIYS
jgi:hypothetical protein